MNHRIPAQLDQRGVVDLGLPIAMRFAITKCRAVSWQRPAALTSNDSPLSELREAPVE